MIQPAIISKRIPRLIRLLLSSFSISIVQQTFFFSWSENSTRPFIYPAHEKPRLEEQLEDERACPSPEPEDTELKEERSFSTSLPSQVGQVISFSSSDAKQSRSNTLPHLRHLNS
jgi:hypothetical protein